MNSEQEMALDKVMKSVYLALDRMQAARVPCAVYLRRSLNLLGIEAVEYTVPGAYPKIITIMPIEDEAEHPYAALVGQDVTKFCIGITASGVQRDCLIGV